MILDTSFLVDVLRGRVPEEYLEELGEESFKVSAITLMELYEGIERSHRTGEEKEEVENLLEDLKAVDVDEDIAMKTGKIRAKLEKEGKTVDVEDIMIGSTALVKDEKVLTRNTSHFERIEGLEVESY